MKKILILSAMALMLGCGAVYAQITDVAAAVPSVQEQVTAAVAEATAGDGAEFPDLSSVIAFIGSIFVMLVAFVPQLKSPTGVPRLVVALVLGVVVCLYGFYSGQAPFLVGDNVFFVVIQGIIAGLAFDGLITPVVSRYRTA